MAQSKPVYSMQGERELIVELQSPGIRDDLRSFVRFAYPWGKPGTPLEHQSIRGWQDSVLAEISQYIRDANNHVALHKAVPEMFKMAIASGRGIGKSALFAWLAHWLVSTRFGSSVWVTANGEPQLVSKTFPEISKWVSLSINSHWFNISATKIDIADWLRVAVQKDLGIDHKYWYIAAQLWSEETPDAFAGAHNHYGEMYLFDEASGIPSSIWTVAQGVFTEKIVDRYWLAFSNPRRNSGAFFECFNKDRAAWRHRNIDARTVEMAEDAWRAIINKYGPDSDEARVEVYGQFPASGANQFISKDDVRDAQTREVAYDPGAPILMGVDVARFGKDESVIAFRVGRDATAIPWKHWIGIDTATLAQNVADLSVEYKVDAIFVDGGGVGGGVVDMLRSWGYKVIEVQSGETPSEPDRFFNTRVEMWNRMKEWLPYGRIPDDITLEEDLIAPEYSFHPSSNKLMLETKEQMRKRGVASPNRADALALTFAKPVARKDIRVGKHYARTAQAAGVDDKLFV